MPKGEKSKKLSESDIERIIELYTSPDEFGHVRGTKVISKMFSVSPSAIRRVLAIRIGKLRSLKESYKNKIPSKPIKNMPPKGQSPPFCKCGCGNCVEWNRRKNRWNVFVSGHYRQDALYKNRDWLVTEYQDKHRDIIDIANQFGVCHTTIVNFMDKFGIPRRKAKDTLAMNGKVRGPKNPAWKGGIAKWSYSPDWKRIARKIRKRDNYTCQVCKVQFPKTSKLLHVHHKDGNKFNNSPDNLITVCASCHPK